MIFDATDDFDVKSIAFTMVGLIAFTLFFEKIMYLLKAKAHPYPHYKEMLEKIVAELTILGFLSFTLTILVQSGVLPHNEILLSFEFSHVLIFFVACLLVIQGLNLAVTSSKIKKNWARAKNMAKDDIAAAFEKNMGNSFFILSPAYEHLRWWLLRKLFLQGQAATEGSKVLKLPDFDFGMYLEINLNFLVVDFVEIEEATWAITAFVGTAIRGVYFLGHSTGSGDGVKEFCIVGYCGLAYTLCLLWMAFSTTARFICLLGLPNANYKTLLAAFKAEQANPQPPTANPITSAQFQACFPFGSSRFFHVALDLSNMFNCFYCGLFLEHFMKRAYSEHDTHMLFLLVIPPVLGIFVLSPMIIKQYALFRSVAALEEVSGLY
jgi:hypothetical protein